MVRIHEAGVHKVLRTGRRTGICVLLVFKEATTIGDYEEDLGKGLHCHEEKKTAETEAVFIKVVCYAVQTCG